ncbi:MAG: HEAT repeat domain-containing protein [Verrucomicrobia bacterium]|nr:HEAT repeat domain-containing protein [Verrucomicrobiota bacterium]
MFSLSIFIRSLAPVILATALIHAAERPKLTATKWSADINVPDPVSCSVDDQGRVFVTSTARRKDGDLDIRQWTQWIPDDQSLQSIEDKAAFYRRALAPGQKPLGPLRDANGDGSIDWRDLTVPTERIYRLVDSNRDGKADQITTFAEGFNTEVTGIAAGVLAYGGSVYSTIAPDLWRFVDKDGDGKSDSRESIVHGFGIHIAYAGHDMHGLRVGPDGRIYWSIGDKGVNVTSKEGRKFFYPNEGCILRCEPDGSNFEVYAHGLRNVQETDFNELGDLFGVDNDADKPGEKERLVFITEQSDSGWRCGFQFMKSEWCPWMNEGRWKPEHAMQPLFITPPIVNSHDGPAGFAFNPGTALAPAWRGWFFLNQFPSGKMNALRLESAGATWKLAEDVPVSSGIMGVGMSWGPEGQLYFADWDGGYPLNQKGAIWTLDAPATDRDPLREEVRKRIGDGYGKLAPDALRAMLGHADVRLRKGAQFELAHRGAWDDLLATARNAKALPLARLHAVWGLGQGLRWGKWIDANALVALSGEADSEVRAQTAKVIGEAPAHPALGNAIIRLIGDSAPRVRFHAALACRRMKIPEATAALLKAASEHLDDDPWTRHALVSALAGSAKSGELSAATRTANRPARVACLLALARNHDPAVAEFLADSDPLLAAEAAIAIHDDLGIPEALPQLAAWLEKAPKVASEAALRRAVNANFRIGTPEAAARIAAFASGPNGPESVRQEALTLLTLWIVPPVLDHTDGRYRALPARPAEPIRAAIQPHVAALLAINAPALRALGLEVLVKMKLTVPADKAAALVADAKVPIAVRREALRLLATQDPNSPALASLLDKWLDAAPGREPAALRGEALGITAKKDPARAFRAAQAFLVNGETEERQAAWAVLGALRTPEADAALAEGVKQLASGAGGPPATRLDLLEAAAERAPQVSVIAAALNSFEKSRAAAADTLATFTECLEGGDVTAGREIALMNVAANCVACHRFEGASGSEVGPALDGVASRGDSRYLLESLIEPSAKMAAGYGLVTVTNKGGETAVGNVLAEDDTAIRLRQPDGKTITIPKVTIASRTPPVSVMPPMITMLTKRQLRDVVAYLGTLKSPGAKPKKPKAK